MSKFGELIDVEVPVLFDFYAESDAPSMAMHDALRDVAAIMGDKAKVIKIDVDKNQELAEALRIKELPTFIVYKDSEMKWRQSGTQNADQLIAVIENYV